MPFIQAKKKSETEPRRIKLDQDVFTDLMAYADFTNSDEHYVTNEILTKVFAGDKEFQNWKQSRERSVTKPVQSSDTKVAQKPNGSVNSSVTEPVAARA